MRVTQYSRSRVGPARAREKDLFIHPGVIGTSGSVVNGRGSVSIQLGESVKRDESRLVTATLNMDEDEARSLRDQLNSRLEFIEKNRSPEYPGKNRK